jgi:hypothetical protein
MGSGASVEYESRHNEESGAAEVKIEVELYELRSIARREAQSGPVRAWWLVAIWLGALLMSAVLVLAGAIHADPMPVRYAQGLIHGFLTLQTLDGDTIAIGDLTQIAKGGRVSGHLVFHFKDGSLYDETFVFAQRTTFHLLSDHLIQKGPSFKQAMETTLDASTGQEKIRYTDNDGKEKVMNEQLKLPPDLANGMLPILVVNVLPSAQQTMLSMVVATPKPRIVKLAITPAGEDTFLVAGVSRKATHYVVKIELGGVAGVVAPVVGKQPPDTNMWVLGGEAPMFLRSEGPLYEGGPIWRIEPVSPTWPQASPAQ